MPATTYFKGCYAILGVLPFTAEQFYCVFREYNTTVWPAQIFLLVLAVVAIALVVFPRRWSDLGVSSILAFLWAWLGLVYHLSFLRSSANWRMDLPLSRSWDRSSFSGRVWCVEGLSFVWLPMPARLWGFC